MATITGFEQRAGADHSRIVLARELADRAELGIRTVAIHSREDRFSLHRTKADESYLVGEGKGPIEAYLDIDDIVRIAREARVDAIHPGYGFLSESPEFAESCAAAGIGMAAAVVLLVAAGVGAALVSDWFVDALAPAIHQLHISQAFAGLVIVAIAGNAVENTAGLVLSYKRRSDLAISVVKNSVAQIAAFLFPVLVLVSFALNTTLTFALAPVYIGALALTALGLWQVTGDGEAAEFEGWALVALYVILATLTLYE